jgi:hypothetical protein
MDKTLLSLIFYGVRGIVAAETVRRYQRSTV